MLLAVVLIYFIFFSTYVGHTRAFSLELYLILESDIVSFKTKST